MVCSSLQQHSQPMLCHQSLCLLAKARYCITGNPLSAILDRFPQQKRRACLRFLYLGSFFEHLKVQRSPLCGDRTCYLMVVVSDSVCPFNYYLLHGVLGFWGAIRN